MAEPEVEDSPAVSALMEVSIVAHLSDLLYARHLPAGITTAQFGVLNRLVRLELEETLGEVASAFRVAPATMSSTVEKLRQKSLVKLVPCAEDGRRKRLKITTAGREVRSQGIEAQHRLIEKYGSFVSESDWEEVATTLNRIRLELEQATGE